MAAWCPGGGHRLSEHEGPPGFVAPLLVPTPDPDSGGSQVKDGLLGLMWSEPVAPLRLPAVNSAPLIPLTPPYTQQPEDSFKKTVTPQPSHSPS